MHPAFNRLTFWIVAFAFWFAHGAEAKPKPCYNSWFDRALMDKFFAIGVAEARRKKAWIRDYKGFIAIENTSRMNPGRKVIGLRFKPWSCDVKVMDGGGFDIEIDPHTHAVIDSYQSGR